jgi:hypothetical protein
MSPWPLGTFYLGLTYGLPKNDGRLALGKRRRRARISIAMLSELTNAFFILTVLFQKILLILNSG